MEKTIERKKALKILLHECGCIKAVCVMRGTSAAAAAHCKGSCFNCREYTAIDPCSTHHQRGNGNIGNVIRVAYA